MKTSAFEKVKFAKVISNGAGKYYAEAHCWFRKAGSMHAGHDIIGIGKGASIEEAKTDAIWSAHENHREYMG